MKLLEEYLYKYKEDENGNPSIEIIYGGILATLKIIEKDQQRFKDLAQYNYLSNTFILHESWYEDVKLGIGIPFNKIKIGSNCCGRCDGVNDECESELVIFMKEEIPELIESPIEEIKQTPSIGEEFVSWAEKYYRLDKRYEEANKDPNSESMPYDFVKNVFATKINELITKRLEG